MRWFILSILLALPLTSSVNAADEVVAPAAGSCQGDACELARTGTLRHLGHNRGTYEGIGTGSTRESAIRRCCYWGSRTPIEIGVAQGRFGRWYAVVRYR